MPVQYRELQARETAVSYSLHSSNTQGLLSPTALIPAQAEGRKSPCSKKHVTCNVEIPFSPTATIPRTYAVAEHGKKIMEFIALSLEKNHSAWMWKSSNRKRLQSSARRQRTVFHMMQERNSLSDAAGLHHVWRQRPIVLSLVKEDYCISDLQEGLLCLKWVEYNQDKLKSSNMLVEGFTGFVTA